jgi:hypothetical protein
LEKLVICKRAYYTGVSLAGGRWKEDQDWGDRWVQSPSSYAIQSPISSLPAKTRVAALIDFNRKEWNSDLVREVLSEEEATKVLNIPLSPVFPIDRLIWLGTKSGLFSVRSAYHLCMELHQKSKGDCSNPVKRDGYWQDIWSLKAPNSVKMFLWRASRNILPTKSNLFLKRVVDSKTCPCCLIEDEDVLHALWSCPAAQDIWGCGQQIFQKSSFIGTSFQQLFRYFSDRLCNEDLVLMAFLCQRIWFRRNRIVFDTKWIHPSTVVKQAKAGLDDFQASISSLLSRETEVEVKDSPKGWQPPFPGSIKINWDASINNSLGCIGIGVMARDYAGKVVGAKCLYRRQSFTPDTAEMCAALEAVVFCKEAGFRDVIMEGDALNVVKEINSNPPYLSRLGHFVEAIKRELHFFQSIHFVYAPRELNYAAHGLAKEASGFCLDRVWLEETPSCISDVVLREQIVPRS